jgi:hypothetical protein
MHETSIHDSLKEIRGETHSNARNHTENKGTKNKHKRTTKNTTPNLLTNPERFTMSTSYPRENGEENSYEMRNGRGEMKP